jgi:hypothetical protein
VDQPADYSYTSRHTYLETRQRRLVLRLHRCLQSVSESDLESRLFEVAQERGRVQGPGSPQGASGSEGESEGRHWEWETSATFESKVNWSNVTGPSSQVTCSQAGSKGNFGTELMVVQER